MENFDLVLVGFWINGPEGHDSFVFSVDEIEPAIEDAMRGTRFDSTDYTVTECFAKAIRYTITDAGRAALGGEK